MSPNLQFHPFDRIAALLEERIGLAINSSNRDIIRIRLERMVRSLEISLEDLYSKILDDPALYGELLDIVTTHETRFFREPDTLRYIADHAVPELGEESDHDLAVLSAGCSTGEEVFSLRMFLLERNPNSAEQVTIKGIDLSSRCILTAEKGIYSPHAVRDVPPLLVDKYMEKLEDDRYMVRQSVKKKCSFSMGNLLFEVPLPDTYDMILCRNLLMYLTQPARADMLLNLTRALRKNGLLFLGKAETLRDPLSDLKAERSGTVFYYRRK